MRRWVTGIVVAMVAAFLFASGLAAAEKGPATVDLKGPTKNAVHFEHAKHQAVEGATCKTCHHKEEAGKPVDKCSKCHNDTAAVKMKDAMHKTCQGCHKDFAKAGKKAGPTMKCGDCHK